MTGCKRRKKWRRGCPGKGCRGARAKKQEQMGAEIEKDVSRGKRRRRTDKTRAGIAVAEE